MSSDSFYNQSEFRYKSILVKSKKYGRYSLSQTDFDTGTYRITKPGYYVLTENIKFNPNSDNNWMPTPDQSEYSSNAYRLGFFAAISVETHDVHIDLNSYTLEQHPIHALQQRFYANIELADQPFIPTQGPANFGLKISSASRCVIENGTLGISAHHGIHGNNNTEIIIKNVIVRDFEIAAIALNGVNNLLIKSCKITNNRHDIPVLGTYSAARFIIPVLKYAVAKHPDITFNSISGEDITNTLQNEIDVVLDQYIQSNYDFNSITNKLFKNNSGLIDGNCYGILINKVGVAVHGFANKVKEGLSNNVTICNTTINNIKCNVHQIVTIPVDSSMELKDQTPQLGTFCEAFDFNKASSSSGRYVGNSLSNAHMFLAKCKNQDEKGPYNTLSITKESVDWAESGDPYDGKFMFNGDCMFHINKGVVGLRIDSTKNCFLYQNRITNIYNGGKKFTMNPDDFVLDDNFDIVGDYAGDKAHGMVIAGSSGIWMEYISIVDIQSIYGYSYGVAIVNGTDVSHKNDIIVEKVSGKYGDSTLFVDGDSNWLN
jgi:hypothetical protein